MAQRADRSKTALTVGSAFHEHDGTSVFLGHAGAVPGYLCFAWRDPKNDITIVWFGSSTLSNSRTTDQFLRVFERALFDLALADVSAKSARAD